MKQIINGKLYDSDNSELIYRESTFSNRRRSYYQTKKGAFFCLYQNGEISGISEKEMREILGRNDIDAYIKIFGEVEEA